MEQLFLTKYKISTGECFEPNYYDAIPESDGIHAYTEDLPTENYIKKHYNAQTRVFYEGASSEILGNRLALHVFYPELEAMPYKLIQLDNLEGIKRDSTLANKGLKGEKKYKKDGQLVWSSEKKYWFQPDGYPDGFRRITKLYKMNGEVFDSWERHARRHNLQSHCVGSVVDLSHGTNRTWNPAESEFEHART